MEKTKIAILAAILLLTASSASAHVTVKPGEVGVGSFQTFTVSVPNERNVPTTGIRLVLPEGLEHVTPTVKPGWRIEVVHGEGVEGSDSGHGDEEIVKEIIWSGGGIGAGFRDDFSFSARVPATQGSLFWKAYQSYGNSVVAWELLPNQEQPKNAQGQPDFTSFGPASQTKVIDDLAASNTPETPQMETEDKTQDYALWAVSILALVIAVLGLILRK